ncbi:hypothetical protein H6G74_12425 [Nostoc spongiaeforme FACHB-130]|uniref:Uncharacterized protein n=1 Tax=Nostoc spongiaeforme FACHB-130 TaxID=1357510 RepID=A0ABR8FUL2_9NOSO|nr:hypothetical protein [Nostoc spongiaeforme]MBD2595132.1 hypothetical protein [Nostoc spongiaeforme FACHB-130]
MAIGDRLFKQPISDFLKLCQLLVNYQIFLSIDNLFFISLGLGDKLSGGRRQEVGENLLLSTQHFQLKSHNLKPKVEDEEGFLLHLPLLHFEWENSAQIYQFGAELLVFPGATGTCVAGAFGTPGITPSPEEGCP